MDQGHGTKRKPIDLDSLARIEEIRSRLLSDPSVRERISQRAYERYEQRGGEPGHDVEDWVQAENEVFSVLIEQEMGRLTKEAAAAQRSQGVGRKKGNGGTRKLGANKAVTPKKASSSFKSSSTEVSKGPLTKTAAPEKKAKKKRASKTEGDALPENTQQS